MLQRSFLPALALLAAAAGAQAQIINIDATHGFTYDGGGSDPAPQPGQHLNLIGTPPQLTLGAGTYTITNAAGLPGALFQAWSWNLNTSSWGWAFVVADHATHNTLLYAEAGQVQNSAAAVAAQAAVQNFSTSFTLAAPTTLDFTLRDYYVNDNGGGISLKISAVSAVAEPGQAALLLAGLAGLGALAGRGAVGRRGRSFRLTSSSRYIVTTLKPARSVSNSSCTRKAARTRRSASPW
jgi:hypothetical protein